MKLFLSHTSEDKDFVRQLTEQFPEETHEMVAAQPVGDLIATQLEKVCRLLIFRVQTYLSESRVRELFAQNGPSEVRRLQTLLFENTVC